MFRILLKTVKSKWKSYRHRFTPWVALNLQRNERTLRQVKGHSEDKTVVDEEVSATLVSLFTALLKNDLRKQREILSFLTAPRQAVYLQTGADAGGTSPSDTMLATLGFSIGRRPSSLPLAGTGVFVTKGLVQKGTVVAMYPGTVYQLHEPILLPSIGNPFVFRCIDGVLIDGNDKNISRIIYRSCSGRDRLGPFALSDVTWLTASPQNPLAVGQYVNNSSNEMPANVCYQEYDVPEGFPLELHQYLPNVNYRQESGRPLRCVVLVSLKEIQRGEELFSNYYTIVR